MMLKFYTFVVIVVMITGGFTQLYEGQRCNLNDGTRGICKSIENCETAKQNARNGIMPTNRCSFWRSIEINRCGDEHPPLEHNPTQRIQQSNVRGALSYSNESKSQRKPPKYSTSAQTIKPTRKAQSQRASVRACREYSQLPMYTRRSSELPYMAALGYINNKRNAITFECSGAVISEYFILTAAHCIRNRRLPKFIRLGRVNLQENAVKEGSVDIDIMNIIKHPKYNASTKKNDIALIQLKTPIQFSKHIRPACLYTNINDLPYDVDLIVAGWNKQISNVLLKRGVRTMPLSPCSSILSELNRKPNIPSLRNGLSNTQYCAHDPISTTQSPCYGYAGDPLALNNSTIATIVGISSFGITCTSTISTVYTRVASYLAWIEANVWRFKRI